MKFEKGKAKATARKPAALLLGIASAAGALALAAGPVPTAAAATPATVAVRSGWFGLEDASDGCLDGNAAGQVYTNPCQVPGNKYQDWNWTEWKAYSPYSGYYYFYSIHDQATGRCLDSNAAGQVYTNACQAPGNAYQDWYWAAEGTSTMFTDVATSRNLWTLGYLGSSVATSEDLAWNVWAPIQ